jgi:hypothetical protein
MQNTIKARLLHEILNSQVLLNREGLGTRPTLLWSESTKFPQRTWDEMDGVGLFVPQGLWNTAPAELLDDLDSTDYTVTLTTANEERIFQYVYRLPYNAALQTVDRITVQQSFVGDSATLTVYVSQDAIDWEIVYTDDAALVGTFIFSGGAKQVRFVLFQYRVVGNAAVPYGELNVAYARAFNNATPFATQAETGIGLKGAILVTDNRAGGLGNSSEVMFDVTNPAQDALNIFDYPYSNDSKTARPAIYLGAMDFENTDKLDIQSVNWMGISQYRCLTVPLVICATGSSYKQAIYRRDVLRAKIRRILMQVPITDVWWLLEISGDRQNADEMDTVSGTGGANGIGVWEAVCVIPVIIHYRLDTTGELRP